MRDEVLHRKVIVAIPLSNFLDIENRNDGVYVRVTRQARDSIDLGDMHRALKSALIVNYDLARIKEVVARARGMFEKVGEPFEEYNIEFDEFVDVALTPLKATMTVSSETLTQGIRPTANMILYCLGRKGVRVGIDEKVVGRFVENTAYDTEILVAEGTPAVDGEDGSVDVRVTVKSDAKPAVGADGKADYRDIKTFTSAKEGEVIAVRLPPKLGKPGLSVTGEKIPAKDGEDAKLPKGENTEISPDGTSLVALKTGIVYEDGGLIHIRELLNVPGDVDFSIGNIKYTGDVVINGNVMPGFVVETEGNIEVHGQVEAASVISRNGSVVIDKGIIGKSEAKVYGKVGVTLEFAQEGTIETEGTLIVKKYLLHCECRCMCLDATKGSGGVIGGTMVAYHHIETHNLGNQNGVPTKVAILDKNRAAAQEKLDELKELKGKIQKQLEPVSRELKTKSALLRKVGASATDRQKTELKKWIDSYNSLNTKLKYVEKKSLEAEARLRQPSDYNGFIRVVGTAYSGVELNMYDISHRVLKIPADHKMFRIKDGTIQVEG